jgi:hypothetical protein
LKTKKRIVRIIQKYAPAIANSHSWFPIAINVPRGAATSADICPAAVNAISSNTAAPEYPKGHPQRGLRQR